MVPAAGAVRQPIPSRAVAGHEEAAQSGRLRDGLHLLKSDRNPRCQRESGREFEGVQLTHRCSLEHRSLRRAGRSTWDRWIRRTGSTYLPRKEVIQPHLPVRLPCYDFVPIASPTFDHSLRKRLGHGLRVLPTFVT